METTIMGLYRGYIGYTLGLYRDSLGIMEKTMETTKGLGSSRTALASFSE